MALFFDQDWFRDRLAEVGQTHDALAAAAGLTVEELAAVWKDQMEVTSQMVAGFASVLGADAGEIASRCGVSTPASAASTTADYVADDDIRAMLVEGLARLKSLESDMAAMRVMIAQLMAKESETR